MHSDGVRDITQVTEWLDPGVVCCIHQKQALNTDSPTFKKLSQLLVCHHSSQKQLCHCVFSCLSSFSPHYQRNPSFPLLILTTLVSKSLPCRRKLSQFVSHHLLRHIHLVVRFAIVDGESQTHEVGQDRGGAFLGTDWGYT